MKWLKFIIVGIFVLLLGGCANKIGWYSPYNTPVNAKLHYVVSNKQIEVLITEGRYQGLVLKFEEDFIKQIKEL
jgi:hypothetical protein